MRWWLAIACLAGSCCSAHPMPAPPKPSPPPPPPATRREAVTDVLFGQTVADPYRWLERGDDAEVQAWSASQNEYARARLAELGDVEAVREKLRTLVYYNSSDAPVRRGNRLFTMRRLADKEQQVVYWRDGESGEDRVLFDPNTWSADGSSALGLWVPSTDGSKVAYKVKSNNADEATVHVMDVATGTETGDVIDGARYGDPSWTPDGAGFYYSWVPAAGTVAPKERPGHMELRYHRLGDDAAKDEVVYPATGDPRTFVLGAVSHDGHWLIVTIRHGWRSADVYFKDLRKTGGKWTTLIAGADGMFDVTAWRDQLYIYTNLEAPMFKVLRADPAKPDRAAWTELVGERADAALQSVRIVGDRLALGYLHDASTVLEVHDLDGKLVHTLAIPALGTVENGITGEPDDDSGYVSYTSFTEPSIVYRVSMKTGALDELERVVLPVDTSQFVTEQVWFPSKDGTKVSMFVVHKRGLAKTGKAPTIVLGYGGFGFTVTPTFGYSRPLWLEAGGVYALPNLRGGGEYGESWHRAGAGVNKQHSIDDLIAAADYLVDQGWTSRDHLGIMGVSNGGLLAAAAMTQAPDRFRAVVCVVPLADMIRYQLSGAGTSWASEYGSVDNADEFAALYAYSPYHHVTAGVAYPALLVLSADSDDRVDPMHARKLVAAVQAASTSGQPVLLQITEHAGHRGPDQVKDQIEEFAALTGFLAAELR